MNQRAKVIIGMLVVVVAILAVALVASVVSDGDKDPVAMRMDGRDPYAGMMQAVGAMDSDAMLTHMREVLGDEGYRRMLDHWRNHRAGGPMTGNAGVDEMMHQMMDSMMQRMPADRERILPLPTATSMPAPAR